MPLRLATIAAAAMLVGFTACGDEAVRPDAGTIQARDVGLTTVSLKVRNTTGQPADIRVWAWVYAGTGKNELIARWPGARGTIDAQGTITYDAVLTLAVGDRINVEASLYGTYPEIASGRGFAVTSLRPGPMTCLVETTGLVPPNGLSVNCSHETQ